MIKFLFVLLFGTCLAYNTAEDKDYYKQRTWQLVRLTIMEGSFSGFYTVQEVSSLLSQYAKNFPDIVQPAQNIGKT